MIILHPYAVPITARQHAAWTALDALDATWRVRSVACVTPTTYEEAFGRMWQDGHPFIVCEHDIVPTDAMLMALAACPEPFCAQAYYLYHDLAQFAALHAWFAEIQQNAHARERLAHWAGYQTVQTVIATDQPYTLAHRIITADGWRWGQADDEYADYVGLGLTKLSPSGLSPDWAPGTWFDLDGRVSDYVHRQGYRFHVHKPLVMHHHGCICHQEVN